MLAPFSIIAPRPGIAGTPILVACGVAGHLGQEIATAGTGPLFYWSEAETVPTMSAELVASPEHWRT